MTRRESREHILKLLYMRDFHESFELEEQNELYFELFTGLNEENTKEVEDRYALIVEQLPVIDAIIAEAMTGWKINRVGKLELNILRLAIYEIRFDESVPDKAAVNEAVELAKSYGGEDSSYGFINGILAKVMSK